MRLSFIFLFIFINSIGISLAQSLLCEEIKTNEIPRIGMDSSYVEMMISEEITLDFSSSLGKPTLQSVVDKNGFKVYRLVFYPKPAQNRVIYTIKADGFNQVSTGKISFKGKELKRYRIKSDRDNPDFVKGNELRSSGNYNEAIRYYTKALNDINNKEAASIAIELCKLKLESPTVESNTTNFSKGLEAFKNSEYSSAIQSLYAALNDDSIYEAALYLGRLYQNGLGVDRDIPKAMELYKVASEHSIPAAMRCYAMILLARDKTSTEAYSYMQKSAVHNDQFAQFYMGISYYRGGVMGVTKDLTKARSWLEKASAQDLGMAQYQLGLLYEKGLGTEINTVKAMQLYEKASRNECSEAMSRLTSLSQ